MKIIHVQDSFTPHCKIIPIGPNAHGQIEGDVSQHAQHIKFFNEFASAVEATLEALSKDGVWFESPKIRIDRENKEILFGYSRALVTSLLHKILNNTSEFKKAICFCASEHLRKAFKDDKENRYHLYFIENTIQAAHQKNAKASAKCEILSSQTKRHEEQWLKIGSALTRHGLFDTPKDSESDYFNKRFQQCDFLFFGETQHPAYATNQRSLGQGYIIHNIEALKSAGVTKVYSEYFLKEHQPLIDYYYAAVENEIPIELAQESQVNGGNSLILLQALKANGIRLIGLEDALSVTGAFFTTQFRIDSFNYRAVKIIRQHYQPGEKSVVAVGGAFLFSKTSIHNLLDVDGFYPRR